MEDIPAPFGTGRDINDNFVVTGDGGWVWNANEMWMDYIFMDQALGFIRPRDINNAGAIIGVNEGFPGTAFYWEDEIGYQISTNILADPLSWTVTDAYAINEDGWILAAGYEGRGPPSADSHYAFLLLRPVPEPGSAVLVTLASAFLLRRRR